MHANIYILYNVNLRVYNYIYIHVLAAQLLRTLLFIWSLPGGPLAVWRFNSCGDPLENLFTIWAHRNRSSLRFLILHSLFCGLNMVKSPFSYPLKEGSYPVRHGCYSWSSWCHEDLPVPGFQTAEAGLIWRNCHKKAVASGNQCHGWRIPWNLSFSCSLRKITRGYIGKQKFYIFIPLKVENLSFFGGWSSNIIELNGWIPASQGVFHRGYGFFLYVSTVSWMIPSNPGPGGLLDQQCLSFMLQRVFAVTENYQARVRIALQNSPKPPLLLVVSCCLLGIFFCDLSVYQWLVGGLEHGFYFSRIYGNNPSHWLIFFRGVGIPPTSV